MNKRPFFTIYITHGLPASGKTLFAKYMTQHNVRRIDVDYWMNQTNKLKLDEFIKSHFSNKTSNTVIDGLFTTNDDIIKILNFTGILETDHITVNIRSFKEDREACLWNNMNRDKDAATSIKHLPYESIDISKIKNNTKFNDIIVETFPVIKKSAISSFCNSVTNIDKEYLESGRWDTGGCVINCYGDTRVIEIEEPDKFEQFRELIFELIPDCSEEHYENIFNKCVFEYSDSESDYYGGVVHYSWYEANIITIESTLNKLGFLTSFNRKCKLFDFLSNSI